MTERKEGHWFTGWALKAPTAAPDRKALADVLNPFADAVVDKMIEADAKLAARLEQAEKRIAELEEQLTRP